MPSPLSIPVATVRPLDHVCMSPARSDIVSRDRMPSLTGLRFFAALLVVLYHLTRQVGGIQPISALVYFGRSGVTFFFVLSGFVLAWTYMNTKVDLPVFYWRRFARLWPLVAVTGVLSLVAFSAVGVEVSGWEALSTFVFLQAWQTAWAGGANPAAWSLSCEAFFYLTFPLLLAAALRRRWRTVLWVATVVALPLLFGLALMGGWMDTRFDYLPATRFPQFVLGVLCGVAVGQGFRLRVRLGAAVALVVTYHIGLYGLLLMFGNSAWLYGGSHWWSAIPFAVLIIASAQADLAGRETTLSHPWLLRLGHWSFAWYLVHEIIIRVSNHWLGRPHGMAAIGLRWAIVVTLSLTVAGLLYRIVEHPAERWLRCRGPGRGAK